MKNIIIALIAATSICFSAHAECNGAPNSACLQQQAVQPRRGTLYRVRGQGHTAYLFGTIHVGRADFYPLEEQVTQALEHAGTLAVEFDIRDMAPIQQAMAKHAFYAEGDSIEHHLAPRSLHQLKQALDRAGIPFSLAARMKPWMVADTLLLGAFERNGFEAQHGIDLFLLSQAQEQKKAVFQLESAESQFSLFDDMSAAEQERYLVEVIATLNNGKALKETRELVDAWATANQKAMESILRQSLSEKTLSTKFTRDSLLDKRNPDMADKIDMLLKTRESTFVGIGMLHLIGKGSVPELLRARGYQVEKLY